MLKTFLRLSSAAVCLLPNLLFAAAQLTPPPAATNGHVGDSYTIQTGDTLVGIARRHGLTPEALAKANALDRPDKIVVGNVLRLPVTPPKPSQTPITPPTAVEQPAPTPLPTAGQPLGMEASPQPAAAPIATKSPETPPAPAAKDPAPSAKAEPAKDIPAESRAKAPDAAEGPARQAVGTYTNPTLGALRVSQTPTGIAINRDNRTIALRHLLYGVFDGGDANGDIHSLRLQYDDAGQVQSVLYSSALGKDIPFARVKK